LRYSWCKKVYPAVVKIVKWHSETKRLENKHKFGPAYNSVMKRSSKASNRQVTHHSLNGIHLP